MWNRGFPGGSDGKKSSCNVGDLGSVPGLGRSPGEGNGYPFQYSCLENSMGQRSPVGYSPWCCKESDTTERLTLFHYYSWFMEFTGSSVVKNLPAMWEIQVLSLCLEHPLEKALATHSSILAWRIPWREFCPFCSLLYLQCLEQCLAHRKQYICGVTVQ